MRESVHLNVIRALSQPFRVLVTRMAQLARGPIRQPGHKHAVVVDQPQLERVGLGTAYEQDVAMLEATLPASRVQELRRRLPGLTGGEGVLDSEFAGYQPVTGEPPVRKRLIVGLAGGAAFIGAAWFSLWLMRWLIAGFFKTL